jgi:hypothetical protein
VPNDDDRTLDFVVSPPPNLVGVVRSLKSSLHNTERREFCINAEFGDDEAGRLRAIGARFGDLFWTLTLTLAMLLDGPRLVAELRKRLPVRCRRQFGALVSISHEAVGGYLAGATLIAALDGLVVLVTALALRIPRQPLLVGPFSRISCRGSAACSAAFLSSFGPLPSGQFRQRSQALFSFSISA